jgi:copper chaperone
MKNEKLVLDVDGMSCEHCVNSIKKAVGSIDGVISVDVNLNDKKVIVEYDQSKAKVVYIKEAIIDEGYDVK